MEGKEMDQAAKVAKLKATFHPDVVKKLDATAFNWAQLLALIEQLLPIILPFLNPTPTPALTP